MTATELKTASFAEVQDQLNLQFRGAGKVALESYGGQLQILETAANEAKETIGYALLDALKSLTGETDIKKLAKDIDTAAGAAALFIKLTTKNVSPATGLWGYWESFAKSIPGYEATLKNFAERLDVDLFPTGPLGNFQMTTGVVLDQSATQLSKIEQERAKAERQRLAKEKASAAARLAAAKKEALLKKQQAILSKAAAVFDLTKIQIAAALKGKITEEEKIRLLLMQAIEEENVDKAEVLQKKLEAIQAINAKIAADLLAIGEATDPFAAWVLSLDAAAAILGKMPALLDATGSLTGRGKVTLPTGDGLPGGNDSIFTPDMSPAQIADAATSAAELAVAAAESAVAAVIAADPIVKAIVETANALTGITDIVTNVPETITATGSSSMFNPYGVTPGSSAGYGNAINYNYVTVEVAGSVLTENDFDEVINKAMLNNIRRGFAQNPAGALP